MGTNITDEKIELLQSVQRIAEQRSVRMSVVDRGFSGRALITFIGSSDKSYVVELRGEEGLPLWEHVLMCGLDYVSNTGKRANRVKCNRCSKAHSTGYFCGFEGMSCDVYPGIDFICPDHPYSSGKPCDQYVERIDINEEQKG